MIDCPEDCSAINNTELIASLNSYQDSMVGGIAIDRQLYRSIGLVFEYNGSSYALTQIDFPLWGTDIINTTSNLSLVKFNLFNGSSIDRSNNTVECMADTFTYVTDKVYKVGLGTGLTFGNIVKENDRIAIYGENGTFCNENDLGSAVVLIGRPRKVIGIITGRNDTACFSPMVEDILSLSNIIPVCPQGIYI
jgi:hypothetical protein